MQPRNIPNKIDNWNVRCRSFFVHILLFYVNFAANFVLNELSHENIIADALLHRTSVFFLCVVRCNSVILSRYL